MSFDQFTRKAKPLYVECRTTTRVPGAKPSKFAQPEKKLQLASVGLF
jgi:hypothetical protein